MKFFFEIQDRKYTEDDECNNFLYCFKLCCRVILVTDSVCWDLKTVFKKCNSPTNKNYNPKCGASVSEVSVPCKCHKHI